MQLDGPLDFYSVTDHGMLEVVDVACAGGVAVNPVRQRGPDNNATMDLGDCSTSADTGAAQPTYRVGRSGLCGPPVRFLLCPRAGESDLSLEYLGCDQRGYCTAVGSAGDAAGACPVVADTSIDR